MFTLIGWAQSQDTSGVLTGVNALPDPHVRVVSKDIIVPSLNQLIGVYALGATITQAQLQSPTMRRVLNLDIRPLEVGAVPKTYPAMLDLIANPIHLTTDEALDAFVAEGAAGAEQEIVLAFLGDGNYAKPSGDVFTVRATGATTLTAFAWTNAAMTFSQSLPAGRYAIVGARGESAGMIAFRFVGVGYNWRPGAIGFASAGLVDDARTRAEAYGGLGTWLEFAHNTPPTVDVLSSSADTSEVFHLDLVKVS